MSEFVEYMEPFISASRIYHTSESIANCDIIIKIMNFLYFIIVEFSMIT
jgi:hypothetical protein